MKRQVWGAVFQRKEVLNTPAEFAEIVNMLCRNIKIGYIIKEKKMTLNISCHGTFCYSFCITFCNKFSENSSFSGLENDVVAQVVDRAEETMMNCTWKIGDFDSS